MSSYICLVCSSGGPCVQWSKTIYAILKEGIMGNIHVKLYEICTSGVGNVCKEKFREDERRMHDGTPDKDRLQYLTLEPSAKVS